MTTPQIYGLFAMLTAAAFAGIVFYCIGLRTGKAAGYELGQSTSKAYWKKIIGGIRANLAEARDQLDIRTRDTASLREAMQHIERDLLQRLAAAAPFTDADQAVLQAVANKLDLAADTFAGLNSPDHARFSRQLQAQVLDMLDRLKIAAANTKPHPDSELIEWLNDHAVHYIPDMSLVQIEMPTLLSAADTWPPHLRQMLRAGIERQANDDTTQAEQEDAA